MSEDLECIGLISLSGWTQQLRLLLTIHKSCPSLKTKGWGWGSLPGEATRRQDASPCPAPSLLTTAADAGARFAELGQLAAPLRATEGAGRPLPEKLLAGYQPGFVPLAPRWAFFYSGRSRSSPASGVASLPSFLAFIHCTAPRILLPAGPPRAGEHRYARQGLH